MISGYTVGLKFEMPESWGTTAEEVADSIKNHYSDVAHFLGEHAKTGHLCVNVPVENQEVGKPAVYLVEFE